MTSSQSLYNVADYTFFILSRVKEERRRAGWLKPDVKEANCCTGVIVLT